MNISGRFYVYLLADPRCGSVFYVGKGQGMRAWQHANDQRRGRKQPNAGKVARIAGIHSAGLKVDVQIVFRSDDEPETLRMESFLIGSFGGLTNIMHGSSMTAEAAQRAMQAREDRLRSRRIDDLRRWLANWRTSSLKYKSFTVPLHKDGDRIASEFLSAVDSLLGLNNGADTKATAVC